VDLGIFITGAAQPFKRKRKRRKRTRRKKGVKGVEEDLVNIIKLLRLRVLLNVHGFRIVSQNKKPHLFFRNEV